MSERRTLLIVDDDGAVLRALRLLFDDSEWEVETAPGGAEALAAAHQRRFDAFLIDKNMPRMGGIELIRSLRASDTASAIVVMTGYGTVDSAREALHLGVDGWLHKPFEDVLGIPDFMVGAVAKAASRRNARPRAPGHPNDMARLRLVCVAQSEALRDQLAQAMPPGDHVQTAGASSECITLLGAGTVDLVIIDASGWNVALLAEVVRMAHPEVRVVVGGASVPLDVVARLINLGVKALVDEPIGSPEFRRKFSDVLDGLRQRKKLEST